MRTGWQTRRMRPQLETRTWPSLLLGHTEEDLGFVERFVIVAETPQQVDIGCRRAESRRSRRDSSVHLWLLYVFAAGNAHPYPVPRLHKE